MVKILKTKAFYLISAAFLLLGAFILFLNIDHGAAVIYLNENQCSFCNYFFKYASKLVEIEGFVVIALILMLLKFRYFVCLLIVLPLAGLLSNFLKKFIFPNCPRPKAFFEGKYDLNFIEGVDVHSMFSFPSGHTLAAFALFSTLAFMSKKPWSQLLFLAFGASVAISRIYLSQHFLIDVIVGATIGILLSLLLFDIIDKKLLSYKKLDHSLISIFSAKQHT